MPDGPTHLMEFEDCVNEPHTFPYINLDIEVSQTDLDGINTLITYCAGMERGQGNIPGLFETTMFYRSLRSKILAGKRK